ncbi:MAG: TlpA disulfide reductase family protein [Thermodesulfovibrionales bacterium]
MKFFFLLPFLVLTLLSCTGKSDEKGLLSAAPGSKAPDFTAKDLSGKAVSLSGLAGRVVVLEFWATWCPPCRSTISDLITLQDRYRDRNVTVLAVSVDEGRDLVTKLSDFSRENKVNYTILLGNDAISLAYRVRNIPAVFLIDKTGKIVSQHTGAVEDFAGTISSQIDKLL